MHNELSNFGKYKTTVGVQNFENKFLETAHRQH
jgi:hypothetical protein